MARGKRDKIAVTLRGDRLFVKRKMGNGRTDLLEVRRRPVGDDEYLNYAAIAYVFGISVGVILRNQRVGWPRNSGKPFTVHSFSIPGTVGGSSRKIPFVLRSEVAQALQKPGKSGAESPERFMWQGEWRRPLWRLHELFGVPYGTAREAAKQSGLTLDRIPSPLRGFCLAARESDALEAAARYKSGKERTPTIEGASTIPLSLFAARVYRARNGSDPSAAWDSWSVAQQISRTWKKRCRHLGNNPLRTVREGGGKRRLCVHAGDADTIVRALDAERRGEIPPGRPGHVAAEVQRKFGISQKQLKRWDEDGLVNVLTTMHATHGGIKDNRPQKTYRLDQLEALQLPWAPPAGFETERQLAERLCADTLQKRLYLRNLVIAGVTKGEIERDKDPRARKGFYYKIADVLQTFDALAATCKQSRAGWKAESERNDEWLSWRERDGLSYGAIRNRQIERDSAFPSGRPGLDRVKTGIKSARERRDKK